MKNLQSEISKILDQVHRIGVVGIPYDPDKALSPILALIKKYEREALEKYIDEIMSGESKGTSEELAYRTALLEYLAKLKEVGK